MEKVKNNGMMMAVVGGLIGALMCLLVVGALTLTNQTAAATNGDDDDATSTPTTAAEWLEGKVVFQYDHYHAVALSDSEATRLATQSQARGLSSKFTELANGSRVTDPVSGVTYAVSKAGDEVYLGFSGAEVYVLDGYGLDALVRGQLDEANFAYQGEVTGSFGTFRLYA